MSKNISHCMGIVNAMSRDDQEDLLEKLDQYEKMGIPPEKAQRMAAKDMLEELKAERVDFERLVNEQHPDEAKPADQGAEEVSDSFGQDVQKSARDPEQTFRAWSKTAQPINDIAVVSEDAEAMLEPWEQALPWNKATVQLKDIEHPKKSGYEIDSDKLDDLPSGHDAMQEVLDEAPPLIIFSNGKMNIADGVHRIVKAKKIGIKQLPVYFANEAVQYSARAQIGGYIAERNTSSSAKGWGDAPAFSARDLSAAEAAGFDSSKVWYHGTTAKDFRSFRYGDGGVDELGPGIYFTSNPWYAEAWAGRDGSVPGGRIIPALLKRGDLFDLSVMRMARTGVAREQAQAVWEPLAQRLLDRNKGDYHGWTDVQKLGAMLRDATTHSNINEVLHEAGYIGAFNHNSQIPGQVVVFDARNIRSPWAKFNPKKADSANILHSKRDQTETPEFKKWSKGAPLVRLGEVHEYRSGQPVVVEALHGTTNTGVTQFDRSKANVESDFGAGFYASNTPGDVSENYANETGPDLTSRVERKTEKIADAAGVDDELALQLLVDYLASVGSDIKPTMDSINDLREDYLGQAADYASRMSMSDGAPNTMKVFLRFDNPIVIGGKNETQLDYDESYNEETGEYGESIGNLVEFVEAVRDIAPDYEVSSRELEDAIARVYEETEGEGLKASSAARIIKTYLDGARDENGDSASSEIVRKAFERIGFDGIIDTSVAKKFRSMAGLTANSVHYIAFKPTQIKSATGNSGAFDGENPDIRYSIRAGTSAWDGPEVSRFDDFVYKAQNKMVDAKRVIESITKSVGKVAEDINVYLQEELFHGRAAKRVADFGQMELNPLMERMKTKGLSLVDVEEFMHARHAEEANAVIAQRNPGDPGMQDGGSGMTNAAAEAYFDNLDPALRVKLEDAAKEVDAIIAKTRQLYADYGLESQDTVDSWGQMFQHYVPLQREDKDGSMGIGQGFSVKGKETRGRTGSKRKVVDILANIAMQRERLIVRGEKNRVSQALVGLAMANPNPDFWSVGPPPSERIFDPKTNAVVERVDPLYKSRDNVLVAKVKQPDGTVKEVGVNFNEDDPRALRMAQALKNLDVAALEGLMGVSAKITRYFSAVNTQYNPVFGVVNLIRDVQSAMLNLDTTPLAKKKGRIARDTVSALTGIYQDMRAARRGQQPTSAWAVLWDEFQEQGGQTGYRQMFATSQDRADDLQKILTPHGWMESKWGKIFTAGGALKVPLAQAQKGAGLIFDWLSDYNSSMENGVRLAAYKAGLDLGMSKVEAASLAKNLTVNFNRKGQIGQQAGAVYAFFNAAMQGSARIASTLFTMEGGDIKTVRLSSTGKKVVYGGMLLGTMQALALAAAGFGDDDPPEFVRAKSLIIPTGGKTYVSIPMPQGFNVLPGLGRSLTEFALSGFKHPAKRVFGILGLFADSFNPIGNAGLSMQTLAPTALDPLVALTENRDFTGKPIARTSSNKALPGHSQYKDTASTVGKLLAEAINGVTGGNAYVAGALSPTPDQIDYLIGQVTGGVGREAGKVEQSLLGAVRGEDVPLHKIPLAGRFVGNSASQASQAGEFYANVNRLNELETEVKGLRKDGKGQEAAALLRERPDAYLMAQANVAERQLQRLRREKREMVERGAAREQVQAKEAQMTAVMMRLNQASEKMREAVH